MTRRVLLGALLGGIAIFIAGAITHVLVPISDIGLKPMPNELTLIDILHTTLPGPGVYIYPGMEGVNMNDTSAVKAYEERVKQLPHGLVVIGGPAGSVSPSPQKLGVQFLGDLLAASVAAVLLALAPIATYWRRLLFVTLLGLFAGFLINFPYWNWYGFSTAFLVSDMLDHLLRCLAGGVALA